jgi:nitrile hydratase accessory protein
MRPDTGAPRRPFAAPWQAQVFALVTRLRDAGVLAAGTWSDALGARLARLPIDAEDDAVWRCWVAALEDCLVGAGIARPLQLTSLRQSWLIAAEKTPHGEPIRLGPTAYRMAGLAPASAASARATSETSAGPR